MKLKSRILSLLLAGVLMISGTVQAAEATTAAAEETTAAETAAETEGGYEEDVTPIQQLALLVLADSELTTVFSLKDKTLGSQSQMDGEKAQTAIGQLQQLNGDTITIQDYASAGEMVDALYAKQVDAVLINEMFRDMILEEIPEFDTETRVIYTFRFEEEEVTVSRRSTEGVDVTKEPFVLYFSGIDTYGSVAAKSRSDVNILAVANPVSKQILLVTTPRDYYVELPFANNAMDKLTHAGIYGIDASIETLEQLYDITVHYYARVNFSGFMKIIDALGGVDVYSSRAFTGEVFGVHFDEGMNHVDGRAALSFVRERHTFADGDYQRQRNQMEMVKAVMNKMFSLSIVLTYPKLLAAVADAFTTDLTYDELTNLIKTLLDSNDWNVQTYGVTGEGVRRTTYSMGNRNLYVALQDEKSIGGAKELMQMVLDGEVLPDLTAVEETAEAEESSAAQ